MFLLLKFKKSLQKVCLCFFSCICVLYIVCTRILSEGVVASIFPDTSISLFVFFSCACVLCALCALCAHVFSLKE